MIVQVYRCDDRVISGRETGSTARRGRGRVAGLWSRQLRSSIVYTEPCEIVLFCVVAIKVLLFCITVDRENRTTVCLHLGYLQKGTMNGALTFVIGASHVCTQIEQINMSPCCISLTKVLCESQLEQKVCRQLLKSEI